MATSNARPITVAPLPPLDNVGWEVKVVDYRDYKTVIAVVPEFVSLSVGPELSAAGSGSVTLDLDMPFWDTVLPNGQPAETLRDYEYLWQCFEDGVLQFEFLGQSVEEHFVDDDETRGVTISGPGAADTLRFATLMPPGFPKPAPTTPYELTNVPVWLDPAGSSPVLNDPANSVGYTNSQAKLGWAFPVHWSAMKMWWTIFQAARSRKLLGWVTPLNFNGSHDSGGALWEYVPTVATVSGNGFRPVQGTNLLDFLNDCTGQDYSQYFAMRAEWAMRPGMKLEVRKAIGLNLVNQQGIGVDRSKAIVFYDTLTGGKQLTRTRDEIVNYVATVDQNGHFSIASDSSSIAHWNKRELWDADNLNITDKSRQAKIAAVRLAESKDEKGEWTITLPADLPGRRPLRDFNIGDWISIATYNSRIAASAKQKFRVLAITVTVENDTATAELTLQSLLAFRQHLLENKLTQLINKIDSPGAVPPQPPIPALPGYGGDTTTGRYSIPAYDNQAGDWTSLNGDGSLAGTHVFIQADDPGNKAKTGDFWFDIDSATDDLSAEDPDPDSDPAVLSLLASGRPNVSDMTGRTGPGLVRFE